MADIQGNDEDQWGIVTKIKDDADDELVVILFVGEDGSVGGLEPWMVEALKDRLGLDEVAEAIQTILDAAKGGP
jgi:hypothetical protein